MAFVQFANIETYNRGFFLVSEPEFVTWHTHTHGIDKLLFLPDAQNYSKVPS
jgi:hypothetical protein